MAITDKKTGVWGLDQVYNKVNQGSIWPVPGSVADNHTFWGWGADADGQLAQNTNENNNSGYSSPVQVPGTNWVDVGGIKNDGTLWAWGLNYQGALGLNNTVRYSSPVQVGSGTADNVIDYSSSGYTAGWINSDNELWMCGDGRLGQLANSKNENSPDHKYSSPVQVPGTNWSKISAGGPGAFYTAIKTNGEMWTWGGNGNGQLGQNENTPNNENGYSSPVQIPGTTWSKVYCGAVNVKAIKTDGSLWVWGVNNQAQLGLNNKVSYSSPVQVPGTWANVKFAEGGSNNRFYIESDGSMYQSGQNYQGNMGNNTRSDNVYYSSPIQIPGTWDTDYNPTIHNNSSVAAIKSDGTAWAWGQQQYSGQFGNSSLVNRSSPVQVGGTTEFKWTGVAITQQSFAGIRKTLTSSQE